MNLERDSLPKKSSTYTFVTAVMTLIKAMSVTYNALSKLKDRIDRELQAIDFCCRLDSIRFFLHNRSRLIQTLKKLRKTLIVRTF